MSSRSSSSHGQDDKDRVVVTYSSINTNSFDGYGEMVMGSRGTMIVSQEKEILLYKEAGNAPPSRQTSVSVETVGKKPVLETSPSLAGPSAASVAGQPGHGRPLPRLSRGARALRLLHPPRQRLELPRRQGAPAPMPRRGRPGRRRHRADHQPRHEAEPPDRVRPRVVRLQVGQDPRRHPGHRPADVRRQDAGPGPLSLPSPRGREGGGEFMHPLRLRPQVPSRAVRT